MREWSAAAAALAGSESPDEQDAVRMRGRRLAARVSRELGRPVRYVDPVTGAVQAVAAAPDGRVGPWAEPGVPWATGLPLAGFACVVTVLADVALSRAFAQAFGAVWILANLLVSVGLAPTLYLLREVPFWRWPALGVAAGLVVAWVVLLLGLLGG